MQLTLSILHILVGLFLILVVLLQTGRSGGMGAALGGASSGVFGARGANPFLSKLTAASAIIFFLTSMTLSILSSKVGSVVADQATPAGSPAIEGIVEGTSAVAPAATPDAAPINAPSPTSPVEQPKTEPAKK